jgi:hypothetical protein
MGSCCGNERGKEEAKGGYGFEQETWYKEQIYFDSSAFKEAVLMRLYRYSQKKMNESWGNLSPLPPGEVLDRVTINAVEIARLRPKIARGVPFSHIRPLIVYLFNLDERYAAKQYAQAKNKEETRAQFDTNMRTSRFSAFMTSEGVEKAKEIARFVQSLAGLEDCRALLRVTQLLLWFLSDSLTFSLLSVLITDPSYFPAKASDYAETYKVILQFFSRSSQKPINEAFLTFLIPDMLDNLLIGYIRPEYFGSVLMMFLASGLKGVAQVVAMLLVAVAPATLIEGNRGSEEEFRSGFQSACMYGVEFLRVLEGAKDLDLTAESGFITSQRVRFLPACSILPTPQAQARVLSLLPPTVESLHRVYQASARVLGELYATWRLCKDPQLLLVRIDNSNVNPYSDLRAVFRPAV